MIPYNTDAPLYHPPLATVGLVVLNTVLFFAVPSSWLELEPAGLPAAGIAFGGGNHAPPDRQWDASDFQVEDADGGLQVPPVEQNPPVADWDEAHDGAGKWRPTSLILEYGVGIKPWQWVTSIFMHADFFHLLFNMIALWAFGLVVEGKVGSLVFLAIYMGIGVGQSAVEQTLMSFSGVGGSLGASAAIFGLLGVAIVWAPRNEFDVFWLFGFRAGTIEIPIMVYGFLQFALEFIGIAYGRFGISSGVLHLMGLALGLGIGLVWLRRQWVDCEGWDLINVLRGKEGRVEEDNDLEQEARKLIRSSLKPRGAEAVTAQRPANQRLDRRTAVERKPDAAHARRPSASAGKQRASKRPSGSAKGVPTKTHDAARDVEQIIAAGNYPLALKLMSKLRDGQASVELSQPMLFKLVRDLLQATEYDLAIPLMQEHIHRFAQNRQALQFNLAKLFLHAQRPRKAQGVLQSMSLSAMDDKAGVTWKTLAAHAQQQIADGTIELSD